MVLTEIAGWSEAEVASLVDASEQFATLPDTKAPVSREDKLPGYEASEIRQAILHFNRTEYVEFNTRMVPIRKRFSVGNNAEALLLLLRTLDAPG